MTLAEDMLQKMMRRFDATDENVEDIGSDLSDSRKKVDRMRYRYSILSYK